MCEKEDEERIINSNEFNLTDEMNKKIVGILRLKNNDIVAMYAAKLIEFYTEFYQEQQTRNFQKKG